MAKTAKVAKPKTNKLRIKGLDSINKAIDIYYSCTQLGTAELQALFGKMSSKTSCKIKDHVKSVMNERKISTYYRGYVDTKTAYEVWGFNINDLENRRDMLKAHHQKMDNDG